jgi:sensor histidine kinase regulating citrate/malate metabolism
MDPDSSLEADSFVDVNALVVILGNLIDNAVEAVMKAPKDRRTIDFSIFDESDKILVSVKDTGCGIPPESLEAVFDRDFSTKGPGRGLGLSSVKSLVDAYEGEINVTSIPGQGTEFVVILTSRG